jgi:hypothetical protein
MLWSVRLCVAKFTQAPCPTLDVAGKISNSWMQMDRQLLAATSQITPLIFLYRQTLWPSDLPSDPTVPKLNLGMLGLMVLVRTGWGMFFLTPFLLGRQEDGLTSGRFSKLSKMVKNPFRDTVRI